MYVFVSLCLSLCICIPVCLYVCIYISVEERESVCLALLGDRTLFFNLALPLNLYTMNVVLECNATQCMPAVPLQEKAGLP